MCGQIAIFYIDMYIWLLFHDHHNQPGAVEEVIRFGGTIASD